GIATTSLRTGLAMTAFFQTPICLCAYENRQSAFVFVGVRSKNCHCEPVRVRIRVFFRGNLDLRNDL
ncbi:MAG: hypothetical protein SPE19_00515, partial [Candidatus Faecousia sp.]|nr:hypothetical protein [Candidatus Faecousia sp.]